MELQNLLRAVYELLADGQLEKAVKLVDIYVFEKHTQSNELIGDVIQLRRQFSSIQNAKLGHTLLYDQISVLEGQLTDSITIFLAKLRDYETNAAVRAERSGHGLLMHNIPQRMPMGLPTRCTIRIGAVVDALMKGMEKEAFAKVEEIKVSKLMEVQLLSDEKDAFDIKTVNRSEQEVDFDNFAQWRYDVTPLRQGQFSLTLKISTVKYIDGKDRYAEEVYDITVVVETRAAHLSHATPVPSNWNGVAVLEAVSEEKGTSLIDLLKENKKVATPVIPPYLDHTIEKEATKSDGGPSYPDVPKNVQPQYPTEQYNPPNTDRPRLDNLDLPAKRGGTAKLLTIVASIIAVVALAVATKWYFNRESPGKSMVEVQFAIDKQLQNPEVRVNGKPVKSGYDASFSTITIYDLIVRETYAIEVVSENGLCTDTITITEALLKQANPMHCRVDKPSSTLYELLVISPYPFETLLLDGKPVEQGAGLQEVRLTVDNGMHKVEAVFSDGLTSCEVVETNVLSNSVVKLNCVRQIPNDNSIARFNVQLRITPNIYKLSRSKIMPVVDGAVVEMKPIYKDDFFVFNLTDIPGGQHVFSLTGVYEQYACFDISQEVVQDVTLTFECNQGG
ncbi:MAG: hypothetical protein IPM82_08290 [Saprospiraceae bacterium]|nr:hypothetical protein [Saprospiraceae bacterium]